VSSACVLTIPFDRLVPEQGTSQCLASWPGTCAVPFTSAWFCESIRWQEVPSFHREQICLKEQLVDMLHAQTAFLWVGFHECDDGLLASQCGDKLAHAVFGGEVTGLPRIEPASI
jgi:hypothetical protein